jgi:rhodanese-related sulfurtransferase
MRSFITATVLGMFTVAGGCQQAITDRNLLFISVEEAVAHANEQPKTRYVDPRMEWQFAQGHIPGAINLPYQELATRGDDLIGYAPLIVYGNGGDPTVAEAYTKSLLEQGRKEVLTLRGGLAAWKAAGQPIDTSPEPTDGDNN